MKKTMFKTIFGKITAITISVFIISTIITGALTIAFFGTYAQNQRVDSLKNVAPKIAGITYTMYVENKSYMEMYGDSYKNAYNSIYSTNLESISTASEADIIVAKKSGEIFFATQNVDLGGKTSLPRKEIENALSGTASQETGTLDNIFSSKRLIFSYPIMKNGEIYGVVILTTDMPDIARDRLAIAKLFITIAGIVLVFSICFIYLSSQRMSRPLKNLNRAAKEIAKGNFDTKVAVVGTDEISDLAKTFNYMSTSLKQLDDTQKSFVANVSHELRTPITTISGFLEKILDGTITGERQKEYLEIAYNESKRMSRLVSDMLDISKMSLGQYNITKSNFDITELIRLCVIKSGDTLDEKYMDVNIDFSSEKIMVYADKDAILRVVTNIFDNALKFSDPHTILDIKVFTKENKAFVAITNDGIGIEPKDINHVFERFYKTDKSRNNKIGTGLGLHMVQNILALHGETIAVKSVNLAQSENAPSPQRRTTFVFSLALPT